MKRTTPTKTISRKRKDGNPNWDARQLDALIEEAIVDAYGESEQKTGFQVMLDDNLALPFQTVVLGVEVTVERIDLTSAEENRRPLPTRQDAPDHSDSRPAAAHTPAQGC